MAPRDPAPAHGAYYARPEIYDIAFSFRDVPREVDHLLSVFQTRMGRPARSAVEIACGPGRHAREMARRGLRSIGLDLCREMVAFAGAEAARERVRVEWIEADMRAFSLGEPVDLACCLMDSFAYLTTNDAVVAHLHSVASNLTEGGLYVIEMAHPSNHFGTGQTTENHWKAARGDVSVETWFGGPDDPFDPIAETDRVTVTVRVEGPAGAQELVDVASLRRHTHQALCALTALSGRFEVIAWQGSLDPAVPFDTSKAAWRMVPVLQRR